MKTAWYCRVRRHFPGSEDCSRDDRGQIENAEMVGIDWPASLPRPRVGVVRDLEPYPRWTKYCRFLQNNGFEHDIYDIHAHDWLQRAGGFDVIIGIWSCELHHLQELREKYWFLENYLGKSTYPSAAHALLYEDKKLEAYIADSCGIPFAKTHISHDCQDALRMVAGLSYPALSKIVPGSGSIGVELVSNAAHARRIVHQAFSWGGRKTHVNYARQKGYVYFQDFIPNDGYDIRVIVVGDLVFGYYRKVPAGDFRASGMNLVEKRDLPRRAMAIALELNRAVRSPMLVVDMVRDREGDFHVIEFSPVCQVETPEQLHVHDKPGAYHFDEDGNWRFEPGRYWVHELALREFLLADYIPKVGRGGNGDQHWTPNVEHRTPKDAKGAEAAEVEREVVGQSKSLPR